MLKPAMNKHFITIILLLLCVLVSSRAEARLTLGVVTGSGDTSSEITSAQAKSLASLLAEKLQEDIVVKELSDSATLLSWLDQFAMLDLALLPTPEVKANLGRFLLVGQLDEQDKLSLVCRQGIVGDLPQRAGRIVRELGFAVWRSSETSAPSVQQKSDEIPPAAEPEPESTDEGISAQVELQHVPPLSPGRAWSPQEENTYRDILPVDGPIAKKLVLGVFPDSTGLVQTSSQAEQIAAYLEESLPASVKVREFARQETFAEWFMRYRMVDLAVLSPEIAETKLGRDYVPIVKLFRSDRPGMDSAELVVMRRGQNEDIQDRLQRVLLDMVETAEGQSLMAEIKVSGVAAPEGVLLPTTVVKQVPDVGVEEKTPPVESVVEPAGEVTPSAIESAESLVILPVPKTPAVTPEKTEPAAVPAEPVQPVVVEAVGIPEAKVALLEPLEPLQPEELPMSPAIESAAPDEPVAPLEVIVKELPELPEVVESVATPPVPGLSDLTPELPVPAVMPAEPLQPDTVEAVEVPEAKVAQLELREPEVLPLTIVPAPVVPPAQAQVATSTPLPEVPAPPVEPPLETFIATEPLLVPEQPEIVVAPPAKQVEVAPEVAVPVVSFAVELPPLAPEEPLLVAVPPTPEEQATQEPVALPVEEQPAIVVAEIMPSETAPGATSEADVKKEPSVEEQQKILEEITAFAEAVPAHELTGVTPVIVDEQMKLQGDADIVALLGEDTVVSMVAKSDLPQELLPSGVPIVRPGRISSRAAVVEDNLLVTSMPEPHRKTEPIRPPKLLPEPEPDPGVVYVVPFVSVMVPDEVNTQIFDQFVDILNQEGKALDLQFLILKQGLQRVTPEWLAVRKYVTGEIYAYVEDAGSTSTEMRTKARLTYRRPNRNAPAFGFEYPVKAFFDNNHSSLDIERAKLSEDIAVTLAGELLKALKN
jgi:hypothetical protein